VSVEDYAHKLITTTITTVSTLTKTTTWMSSLYRRPGLY